MHATDKKQIHITPKGAYLQPGVGGETRRTLDGGMAVPEGSDLLKRFPSLYSPKPWDCGFTIPHPDRVASIPKDVLQTITDTITWRKITYNRTSGNRALVIDLPKPIMIDGVLCGAVRVKGTCLRVQDRADEEEVSSVGIVKPQNVTYTGGGQPPAKAGFTKDGRLISIPTEKHSIGGLIFEDAENEYNRASMVLERGVRNVDVPLMYGLIKVDFGGEYAGKKYGFIVFGIRDPQDERLSEYRRRRASEIMTSPEHKSDNARRNAVRECYEETFRQQAIAMRKFHDAGLIHMFPYPANFSYTNGEMIVQDHENSTPKDELTPGQAVGYQINDLQHSIGRFYTIREGGSLSKTGRVIRWCEGGEHQFTMFRQFINGYFEKEMADPALRKMVEGLRYEDIDSVLSESRKKPVLEINHPLVYLIKRMNGIK